MADRHTRLERLAGRLDPQAAAEHVERPLAELVE
jgi:hypothetical protein